MSSKLYGVSWTVTLGCVDSNCFASVGVQARSTGSSVLYQTRRVVLGDAPELAAPQPASSRARTMSTMRDFITNKKWPLGHARSVPSIGRSYSYIAFVWLNECARIVARSAARSGATLFW